MTVYFDYQFENISHPIGVVIEDVKEIVYAPASIVIKADDRFTDSYTHDRITSNIIVKE